MKFLIDENLPPDLCEVFLDHGLTAYHVNQLKSHKKQKVRDDQLRHLSLFKDYVIVTKDDDFVRSYVHRKVPERMIYVFDIQTRNEVIKHFNLHITKLPELVEKHGFLELNRTEIRWPFSTQM